MGRINMFRPLLLALALAHPAAAQPLEPFGVVTLAPALELDGTGGDVDSIAFWEAPEPEDTLMLVTGKANDLLEVWEHPFVDHERPSRSFPENVNGVVVDQEADLAYVSDRRVTVLTLPEFEQVAEFGEGIIGVGENNLDILRHANGQTWIYVSEDHEIHRFDASDHRHLGSFAPPVSSIETILADDFYQMILVPEEQGPEGNPGVYAYHPDGTPWERNGSNRFGHDGPFDSDEEGILLYTFPSTGGEDDGTGFIVVADQRSDQTDFEFFDRQTWAHLGTLRLEGVSNTDGIASTQQALPGYPLGLFAAINDDGTTVGLGWDVLFEAIGFDPAPPTAYQTWAAEKGLREGVDDAFTDDPDLDGQSNLEEFAFEGDPLGAVSDDKHWLGMTDREGGKHFTVIFPVRQGAEFMPTAGGLSATVDGIVYDLSSSRDLRQWEAGIVESPTMAKGLPELDADWEYRSFGLAEAAAAFPRGFLRLQLKTISP